MKSVLHAISALAFIAAASACSQGIAREGHYAASQYANGEEQIVGSGNVVQREIAVSDFQRLELDGPMNVELRQGAVPRLVVYAEDNLIDLVEADGDGEMLTLGTRGSFRSRVGLRAVLTVPSLDAAAITGSGDIDLTDWNADTLVLRIMGSGDIRLAGSLDTVDADINGSGDIDLRRAAIREARASVNGSGDIRLGSLDRLVARIAGSGDIDAADAREVEQSVLGSGDIRIASAR